jgi:hypothetical protein
MKYEILFFGLIMTVASSMSMLVFHEFVVFQITFLLGLVIVGIAYAKIPPEEKPKINTGQVNKNIQTYNDLLWGQTSKKEDPADHRKLYWNEEIAFNCPTTGKRQTINDCFNKCQQNNYIYIGSSAYLFCTEDPENRFLHNGKPRKKK